MENTRVQVYAGLLNQCRTETLQTLEKVSETRRFAQLAPGKSTPLWLVGHLANTVNAVVLLYTLGEKSLLGRDLAMKFAPDFAGGQPPTANADDYPPWDEIAGLYDQVLTKAVSLIPMNLRDADLEHVPAHMPAPLRDFFSSNEVVLKRMVLHDSYHRGQLGMLANLV